MLNNKLLIFILSLLLSNTLYAANVENIEPSTGETVSTVDTGTPSENAPQTSNPEAQNRTETGQNKQPKTWNDAINAALANSKPTPGSHYDKNWHVVIDDPEVYQKALEKERSQNEGKFDYQNIEPQEDPREQNIFYRLYKHNPILGILAIIPLVCLAVVLLKFRDSFKKKK